MKRISVIFVLSLIAGVLGAQTPATPPETKTAPQTKTAAASEPAPPPAPKTLAEALKRIEEQSQIISNLQANLAVALIESSNLKIEKAQSEAQPALLRKQEMIRMLSQLRPGYHWDDAQGRMVPNAGQVDAVKKGTPQFPTSPAAEPAKK